MATKSKLERAVEQRASELNNAQCQIALAQLSTYRKNAARMAELASSMKTLGASRPTTRDALRAVQAERSTLSYEYHQLATANSRIASDLFRFLEDK